MEGRDAQEKYPVVAHLPTPEQPHPSTDGLPEGSVGHPGEHINPNPVVERGKVIAAPNEHYGEEVEIKSPEEAGFWSRFFRGRQEKKTT